MNYCINEYCASIDYNNSPDQYGRKTDLHYNNLNIAYIQLPVVDATGKTKQRNKF